MLGFHVVWCMVIQDIKGSWHKLRRRTACYLTRRSAKNMMKGDEGLTLRQKIAETQRKRKKKVCDVLWLSGFMLFNTLKILPWLGAFHAEGTSFDQICFPGEIHLTSPSEPSQKIARLLCMWSLPNVSHGWANLLHSKKNCLVSWLWGGPLQKGIGSFCSICQGCESPS